MLSRLNFIFIWAGFAALITAYGFTTYAVITSPLSISLLDERFWREIIDIAEFPPRHTLSFTWFWLAHLYWPIRWITTGNKSLLPWVANKEANNG